MGSNLMVVVPGFKFRVPRIMTQYHIQVRQRPREPHKSIYLFLKRLTRRVQMRGSPANSGKETGGVYGTYAEDFQGPITKQMSPY